ncbi:YgaP family membrane protein [Aliiroseovarius sp.]|uniref:YgaP family membrane protein n=1 Tax=Aliiroseovarius sp. TaxID=1872442 RepID=UPI003BAA8B62
MFAKNAGSIDRGLRVIIGLALVAWAVFGGPVWAWIGVVPLLTGAVGSCPAYSIFGISTCSLKK